MAGKLLQCQYNLKTLSNRRHSIDTVAGALKIEFIIMTVPWPPDHGPVGRSFLFEHLINAFFLLGIVAQRIVVFCMEKMSLKPGIAVP